MAITYSIKGGADAGKFNIDATSGALTFKTAPDFETPGDANGDNIYEVDVCATDAGGLYSVKPVKVTVTDVSEGSPPQITSAGAISVKDNQMVVMTVTATDPDDGGTPPVTALTPSGSITVAGHNTVIENKKITGGIQSVNFNNLTIRNCIIEHNGRDGIFVQGCNGLTLQDVKVTYINGPTGQTPLPGEYINIKLNGVSGTCLMERVTVANACGLYAVICPANIKLSFWEGHNTRGPVNPPRGQFIQMNQNTGDMVIEDFSCENDPQNSYSEDIISIYQCAANKVKIRRGLLDGCNSPSGVEIMIENGTSGALIEDVDTIHHGNGAFSTYDASHNTIWRRCRVRDQILTDQGRGNPTSNNKGQGPAVFVSDPTCQNTRFEAVKFYNVNKGNFAWLDSTMTAQDWKEENFTPRSPIRNSVPGGATKAAD
jgi:hypothetical protein